MNCISQVDREDYTLINGDCIEALSALPENSIDYSIFSPPFSHLYVYSNSPRDMGNSRTDAEFFEHFDHLVRELARVIKPGHCVSFHCMQLPTSKERDGYIGLKDFRGDLIRSFQRHGFIYSSEVCIWKDPVTAMQRTKALGLLHKTIRSNATMSRQGIADYLVTMRKPGEVMDKVAHDDLPVDEWQQLASPVWMDINPNDTLQFRSAREHDDERHICLARDSLILTRRGFVPIQEVQVGDLALTHKGRWRPVQVVANTGVRPVVDLRAQGVAALTLTPDHKLWTRKSDWERARDGAERAEPAWIRADETVGGYVNLKMPPVEESDLTEQECWLIGRWLADGHVGSRGDFHVSIGREKLAEFEHMAGEHAGTMAERTAMQVRLKGLSASMIDALSRCGHGAAGKQVPVELLALPAEKAGTLLAGYLSGDGHLVEGRSTWMATSISRPLLLGMAMLAQRAHGAIASLRAGRPAGRTVIDGREVKTRQEWILSFDVPGARRKTPFLLEDGAWKKVRSARPAGEVETWCLRVAEDESFTAEGCIVKNCPLQLEVIRRGIRLWTKAGDVVLTPFLGIGSEAYCAVEMGRKAIGVELKKSYFDQAVKNMDALVSQYTIFDLIDA